MADDKDRVKFFYLDRGSLLALLNWRRHELIALPTFSDLPLDAVVRDVHYDPAYRGFVVCIAHPSFDPVPPGERMPEVLGPLTIEVLNLRHFVPCTPENPTLTAFAEGSLGKPFEPADRSSLRREIPAGSPAHPRQPWEFLGDPKISGPGT